MSGAVRVLVTGVSGGSIGEQVCKALRSGRRTYDIIATNLAMAPMVVVGAEHYAVLPTASSNDYLARLLALVERFEVQFVIPGSEPELVVLAQHSAQLLAAGARLLANSASVIATGVDKLTTFETLSRLGFRVPATWLGTAELPSPAVGIGRPPWIVKPARGGGGSSSTFLAQDVDELQFFIGYVQRCGQVALVQQYFGTPEHEYTVGVLHSPAGSLIGTVVLRRQILSGLSNRLCVPNRTGQAELGQTLAVSSGISQGWIVDCPPVAATAGAMANALGSVGPLNIQGRLDNGEFVAFEINPRFSGTTPMRAMAGFNEPELLIDWYLDPGHQINDRLHAVQGECTRGLVEHFTPQSNQS